MTGGSSHTTKPPSEVTPASLFSWTDMSLTAVVGGNMGGSWSRVLSPLEREMTRTRPVGMSSELGQTSGSRYFVPLVMAYATHWVAPIVVPGRKVESTLTSAIAVDFTVSRGAWISSRG